MGFPYLNVAIFCPYASYLYSFSDYLSRSVKVEWVKERSMTLRDEVWDAALEEIISEGKFLISDLPFEQSERHTVRRVLKELESKDWVTRNNPQSKTWRAGEKAKEMLQLTETARVMADRDD